MVYFIGLHTVCLFPLLNSEVSRCENDREGDDHSGVLTCHDDLIHLHGDLREHALHALDEGPLVVGRGEDLADLLHHLHGPGHAKAVLLAHLSRDRGLRIPSPHDPGPHGRLGRALTRMRKTMRREISRKRRLTALLASTL